MSNSRLKIRDIILEKDFGSFITGDGALDYKNLIPDQPFGKNKPYKRRGTDVANSDDSGLSHAIAQAMFSADKAESNLQDMGVRVSDLQDQDTIDYYKALEMFPFIFSIDKPIDGFFNNESKNISGQASVDKRSNAKKFVIYFTHNSEKGKVVYRINFSSETLQKNLKGTAFDLPMLIKDEIYNVRISLKDGEQKGGGEQEGDGQEGGGEQEGDGQEGDGQEGPAIPPEIKKNRNEIFRLLLKNYGKYNGAVVYGDGFKKIEEAREYAKLQRAVKKGDVDKSKLKEFRNKSSRDKYSMMIANLRKSYPTTFFKKLDKAFPEFKISYTKQLGENYLLEVENDDKYKRWKIVFGDVVSNDVIDVLDKNIRDFMLATKKWFAVPIKYRGKVQSYKIDFDGDKVNDYWNNFYGSKKESILSIGSILEDVLSEKRGPKQKVAPPKGTNIGKGERWDDKENLPKYYDRKLKIESIPNFEGSSSKSSKSNEKTDDQIVVGGKLKITDGGENPLWSITGAESAVNSELKKGVLIRKSKKSKNTVILEWKNPIKIGNTPTKAMLIKPNMDVNDFSNKIMGSGVNDVEVEIGRKAGGDESLDKPSKGSISLKVKN